MGKHEPQETLRTDPLYEVPGGVYFYDYAALQAAKLGIFVQDYSSYYKTGSVIRWQDARAGAYTGSISAEAKKVLTKVASMQDLYRANFEKLRDPIYNEIKYKEFIDFLRTCMLGQDIAERELAEAEALRIEAQRAQALVGAYRLNLHDSPLMAELAATQDIHLLHQVTERLKMLEEEHVKALPAVKLLLSSPTPVEELLTSGSPSPH